MLSLSALAQLEKNKLYSDSVWLILLDIYIPAMNQTIYIAGNTEDVTWNGNLYQCFPFELGDVNDDAKGSLPSLDLKVSNVTRAIQPYLEHGNGGVGSKVTLRVVLSENINDPNPELEEQFTVTKTKTDPQWVTFTLGASYPSGSRRPLRRYLKNHCPFKYKGVECGATASQTTCPKTLVACRARNNSARFGGDPSIPQGGMYL